MSKVALYLRVSTDRQEYEGQRDQLLAWAVREGHTVVKEFGEVISGAVQRQALSDLMEAAHRHEFEMVAFWKLDRLTREGVLPCLLYLDVLNKLGIEVYSHQESWLNPKMPFYGVVVAMVAELAAMERESIRERTMMGMERARREGKHLGRPPGAKDKVRRRRSGYLRRFENERANKGPVNKGGK